MFPIKKKYLRKFNTANNKYYHVIKGILNRNQKTIISECQNYLKMYEQNGMPDYAVNIDAMISDIFK